MKEALTIVNVDTDRSLNMAGDRQASMSQSLQEKLFLNVCLASRETIPNPKQWED